MKPKLLIGDAMSVMRRMPEASVDAIVTDPPYGLGFMGKKWDDLPPGEDWARECLRVLKPGGHLLAFGGTRTWHRLAVAVEDAGFEIRDSIAWMYGSGFPKSLDVSKAIDKLDAADERRVRNLSFTAWMRSTGITAARVNELTGTNMGGHYLTDAAQPAVATADLFDLLRPELPEVPAFVEALVAERTVESRNFKARTVVGKGFRVDRHDGHVNYGSGTTHGHYDITAPATDDARKWDGWGTALKPAFEPIVVARKPLVGTVAANVQRYGTGALNIDGCRIGTEVITAHGGGINGAGRTYGMGAGIPAIERGSNAHTGRWPANVILDSDQAAALDAQSGTNKSTAHTRGFGMGYRGDDKPRGKAGPTDQGGASRFFHIAREDDFPCCTGGVSADSDTGTNGSSAASPGPGGGSADATARQPNSSSRFFYCAKAPKNERPVVDGVAHPTVKPLTLVRWLVRLVTPPGGMVLDPFAGSGTTGEAAILEGFRVTLIEREREYVPLIMARLARAQGGIG